MNPDDDESPGDVRGCCVFLDALVIDLVVTLLDAVDCRLVSSSELIASDKGYGTKTKA